MYHECSVPLKIILFSLLIILSYNVSKIERANFGDGIVKKWQSLTASFMIKTLSKVGIDGTYLNIIKAIWETYSQHHKRAKTKSFPTMIRNKTRVSTFTTFIQHSIRSASESDQTRKRNKMYPNWKGGSKTVIVCRSHDSVHRKSYRLHQKTAWPNKWIWQNSGLQSQYSEIKGIFIHQQWKIRIRSQERYSIFYSNKKNKVPRDKPYQGGEKTVLRKVHNTEERK